MGGKLGLRGVADPGSRTQDEDPGSEKGESKGLWSLP